MSPLEEMARAIANDADPPHDDIWPEELDAARVCAAVMAKRLRLIARAKYLRAPLCDLIDELEGKS